PASRGRRAGTGTRTPCRRPARPSGPLPLRLPQVARAAADVPGRTPHVAAAVKGDDRTPSSGTWGLPSVRCGLSMDPSAEPVDHEAYELAAYAGEWPVVDLDLRAPEAPP